MRVDPFIINWPGQLEKVLRTEKIFIDIYGKCSVINADPDVKNGLWIEAEYGYGRQFNTILNLFNKSDSDFLFLLTGDAVSDDWQGIRNSAEQSFEKYRWGTFGPFIDTSSWKNKIFKDLGSGIRLMKNIDGVAWYIHRDIIDYFVSNCLHAFKDNSLGWGIDYIMSACSWRLRRYVLQDNRFIVNHPLGSGYSKRLALSQMNASQALLDPYFSAYKKLIWGSLPNPYEILEALI